MIVTRARKVVNNKQRDFDPTRREFLKALLSGAVGIAGAYALGTLTPVVHAQQVQPYIKAETIVTDETLRKPYCLVFLENDGKTAVAIDWKGKEEYKSTDHAKVLEEAPKIHPRVIIDGELILEKPVKYSGYNRLEIIGTPRAKILYRALKIKEYAIEFWEERVLGYQFCT